MASVRYTSDELFHFVGRGDPEDHDKNFSVLKAILDSGWVLHRGGEPGWGVERISINPTESLLDEGMIVPEVVCFADIPFEALSIHVRKYGQFGLSLSRAHLQAYGARPVMYFPVNLEQVEARYGRPCLADIEVVFRALREHLRQVEAPSVRTWGKPPETLGQAADAFSGIALKEFLAFIKPFDAQLPPTAENNYYMEREWRRLGNMGFSERDVRSVVVPPAFMDRARNELGPYGAKLSPPEEVVGD